MVIPLSGDCAIWSEIKLVITNCTPATRPKATKLLITGPIPNHDQSVSVTPPTPFSLHHHQVLFPLTTQYKK